MSVRFEQMLSGTSVPAMLTVPAFALVSLAFFAISLHELAYGGPVYRPLEGLVVVGTLALSVLWALLAYREAWFADVSRYSGGDAA